MIGMRGYRIEQGYGSLGMAGYPNFNAHALSHEYDYRQSRAKSEASLSSILS